MPLTLRSVKGSQLTTAEMDGNLTYLESMNAALPPVTITANTSLTASAHANRLLLCNSASPITLTINSDASGWANDDSINAVQIGAGSVTIAGGTATLQTALGTVNTTISQYKLVAATRIGVDSWVPTELSATGGGTATIDTLANAFAFYPGRFGDWTSTGVAFMNALNGTAAGRAYANTNLYTQSLRYGIDASTTTADSNAGNNSNQAVTSFGLSQTTYEFVFGFSDAIASGTKSGIGLVDGWVGNVISNPETVTSFSRFIVGHGPSSTNLKIISGNGSALTVVNTSASFPANTNATDKYKFRFTYFPTSSGSRRVEWVLTNLSTSVSASGTVTTNLPPDTASLSANTMRSNGAGVGVGQTAKIDIFSLGSGRFV